MPPKHPQSNPQINGWPGIRESSPEVPAPRFITPSPQSAGDNIVELGRGRIRQPAWNISGSNDASWYARTLPYSRRCSENGKPNPLSVRFRDCNRSKVRRKHPSIAEKVSHGNRRLGYRAMVKPAVAEAWLSSLAISDQGSGRLIGGLLRKWGHATSSLWFCPPRLWRDNHRIGGRGNRPAVRNSDGPRGRPRFLASRAERRRPGRCSRPRRPPATTPA